MPLVLDPSPGTGPTFTVDGYDFWPYLRTAPGEGLDPADADFLEPQFAESAVGAGDPLLGIRERNREMVWPLHLSDINEAAMHQLVRDVNRVLRNASQVEWKAESAAASTFLDVVFARFEPDFNYRKAGLGYLSGLLRIYTKPYGHTGTARLAGTAAGTGVALAVNLGSLDGDAPAQLRALIQTGTQAARTARAVGAALIPSGYVVEIPAASLIRHADATLMAASGAAGSQAVGIPHEKGTNDERDTFRVALAPASVYEGRNRLYAIANYDQMPGVHLQAFDRGCPLSAGGLATLMDGEGWGLVDLGILDVDTSAGQATAVADVKTRSGIYAGQFSRLEADGTQEIKLARVSRVLVLPENDLALVLDTRRRRLAETGFNRVASGAPGLDLMGNPWASVPSHAPLWEDGFGYARGYSPTITGFGTWGSKLAHPTTADLLIEAAHLPFNAQPSLSLSLAKDNAVLPVVVRHSAHPSAYISIRAGGLDFLAGTLLASVAYAAGATPNAAYLSLHTKGPAIEAVVRDGARRVLATVSASHANAGQPGQAVLMTTATGGGGAAFDGLRVAEVPSMSLGGRDRIELDAVNRAAPKTSPSAVYLERVDGRVFGNDLEADPTRHAQLVALQLPIDGGVTTDLLNAEVRVREQFVFGRP